MNTRRNFLAALASLPFLGWLAPRYTVDADRGTVSFHGTSPFADAIKLDEKNGPYMMRIDDGQLYIDGEHMGAVVGDVKFSVPIPRDVPKQPPYVIGYGKPAPPIEPVTFTIRAVD